MTTNLFVIANVKQLRTDSNFRILLPFFRTSWCVGVLNSAIFKFSQSGWVWHDFWGPSEFRGRGGLNTPNSIRHATVLTYISGNLKMGLICFPETSVVITSAYCVITQKSAVLSYFAAEARKLASSLLGNQGDFGMTADFFRVKLSRGGTPPWLLGVIIRHKKSFHVLRHIARLFISRKAESRTLAVGRDYCSLAPRILTPCMSTRLASKY